MSYGQVLRMFCPTSNFEKDPATKGFWVRDSKTQPVPEGEPEVDTRRGLNRQRVLRSVQLHQILRVWPTRQSILTRKSRRLKRRINHDLFEVMAHTLFPKRFEAVFVYTFIWWYRDGLKVSRIAELLGVTPDLARRYVAYIKKTTEEFLELIELADTDALLSGRQKLELFAREEAS